jgi:hypothetical protein
VKSALNGLRDKGLIDWQTGGIKKRGRFGQMLANEYVLNLPVEKVKAEMEKKRKGRQADPALATTRPTPRPPDGQRLGHQKANALATRWPPTININKNNIEMEPPIPDGNGLNCDKLLKKMGIEKKKVNVHSLQNEPSQKAKMSPVGKALNACGLKPGTDEYKKYNQDFSREMLWLGESEVTDLLQVFDSDVQQGKLKDCPSLPQEFLRRVKEKIEEQHP